MAFGDYEDVARLFKNEAPQRLAGKVKPFLRDGMTILDAGCGTGLLAAQFVGLDLVLDGIDFDEENLAEAKKKNIYRNIRKGDLKQVLFTSPQYDAVISAGVFGDYLETYEIGNLIIALHEEGIIATCGTCDPELFLRNRGFQIKVKDREYAYTIGGTGPKAFYDYVVAQKKVSRL